MEHAFEGLDEARIEISDKLEIFGINPSRTIWYYMYIKPTESFRSTNENLKKSGVTVNVHNFKEILKLAHSGNLSDFRKTIISVEHDNYAKFEIVGGLSTITHMLPHTPRGIKKRPRYLADYDFTSAAGIIIKPPKEYKLVFDHFNVLKSNQPLFNEDVIPIVVEVKKGHIRFEPHKIPGYDHTIRGKNINDIEAKSFMSLNNIKLTSEVVSRGLSHLEILVLENNPIKFRYPIDADETDYQGVVEYFVVPTVPPE